MSRERYAVTVGGWNTLGEGLEHNADDYPELEKHRLLLKELATSAGSLVTRRNALEAEKQAVTSELQAILDKGRRVASLLRAGMRLKYGTGSEKLVEFGLQPRRRRSRRKPDDTPAT